MPLYVNQMALVQAYHLTNCNTPKLYETQKITVNNYLL